MADKSLIEWTDATWNPITGCSMVSEGCRYCYAARLAATRLKHLPSREGLAEMKNGRGVFNGRVRFNEEWLHLPLQWKKPRRIFVVAHGDLFHENVPDEWIDRVFGVMALADQHEYQVLTKRSKRLLEYMTGIAGGEDGRLEGTTWRSMLVEGNAQRIYAERTGEDPSLWLAVNLPLPHVVLMVSAEDQATADERIPDLQKTPAAKRGVSLEPLLAPITLRRLRGGRLDALGPVTDDRRLDWVIVGGESGPGSRPMHLHWAQDLRDECAFAGVPFHFKQWGDWTTGENFPDPTTHRRGSRPTKQWFRSTGWEDCSDDWATEKDYGPIHYRIGKKKAGRLLDGVEHNGMPA